MFAFHSRWLRFNSHKSSRLLLMMSRCFMTCETSHWRCITRSAQVSAFVQRIRLRGKPFVANDLGIEKARGTTGRGSVLLPRIRVRYQLANPSCLI